MARDYEQSSMEDSGGEGRGSGEGRWSVGVSTFLAQTRPRPPAVLGSFRPSPANPLISPACSSFALRQRPCSSQLPRSLFSGSSALSPTTSTAPPLPPIVPAKVRSALAPVHHHQPDASQPNSRLHHSTMSRGGNATDLLTKPASPTPRYRASHYLLCRIVRRMYVTAERHDESKSHPIMISRRLPSTVRCFRS